MGAATKGEARLTAFPTALRETKVVAVHVYKLNCCLRLAADWNCLNECLPFGAARPNAALVEFDVGRQRTAMIRAAHFRTIPSFAIVKGARRPELKWIHSSRTRHDQPWAAAPPQLVSPGEHHITTGASPVKWPASQPVRVFVSLLSGRRFMQTCLLFVVAILWLAQCASTSARGALGGSLAHCGSHRPTPSWRGDTRQTSVAKNATTISFARATRKTDGCASSKSRTCLRPAASIGHSIKSSLSLSLSLSLARPAARARLVSRDSGRFEAEDRRSHHKRQTMVDGFYLHATCSVAFLLLASPN